VKARPKEKKMRKRTHRQRRRWSPLDDEKMRIVGAITFTPELEITPVSQLQEAACEALERDGILAQRSAEGQVYWVKA
jgi:hypothetical protein